MYIHTSINTHVVLCIQVCVNICMCIYMQAHWCTCVHMCVYVPANKHSQFVALGPDLRGAGASPRIV